MICGWPGAPWWPWNRVSGDIKRSWNVLNLITGRISVLHCNCIKKRFYCTSNLLSLLGYSIILKISEIRASYISFDIAVMRVLRHECRADKVFIISYRIERRHYSVSFSLPWKDSHFYTGVERQHYRIFRDASCMHYIKPVTLFKRSHY